MVAPADLDGDGDLDLFISALNEDGWYENRGDGEPPVFHLLATHGYHLAVTSSLRDLNGDGDVDILIMDAIGRTYRFENLGGREFSHAIDVLGENYQREQLAVSDVDGDGLADLVTTERFCVVDSCSEVVGWHANQGDGTFAPDRSVITAQQNVDSLHLVDLNGDGRDDLVLGNGFCSPLAETCMYRTTWYPNLGEGEFTRRPTEIHRQPISEFYGTSETFWRDVDGDGDVDGIIAADFSGRIVWVENMDGRGEFSGPQLVASWSGRPDLSRFAVGDLDGDGDVDVIASDERGRIFHSRFDGERKTFGGWRSVASFFDIEQLAVIDMDGDRDGDVIAVPGDRNRVAWFESLSDATFAPRVDLGRTLNRIDAARAADLDGDGDQDLLIAMTEGQEVSVEWYENTQNDGGRRFVRRFIQTAQTGAAVVDAGDIDADGDVDVLVAISRELVWLVNNGSEQFDTSITLRQSRDTYESRVVDFDGDGDLDTVGVANDSTSWYENVDGKGSFEHREILGDVRDVRPHTIADYDADGDIDIILETTCSGVRCVLEYRLMRNNEGQFDSRAIFRHGEAVLPGTGVFGDLDGDRDLDMVFHAITSGDLTSYTNHGAGMMTVKQVIESTTRTTVTPDLADIDGDGDLDVIAFHRYGTSSVWYENLANDGEFAIDRPFIEFESTRRDVIFDDWDTDGDVDVMAISANVPTIRWFENRPVGDANGDGVFDSSDLVAVFQRGKYEDAVPGNASFEEGDWNGDGDFDSSDLMEALQSGGYQ